ncbi:receptor-transporting protein 1-like isoform X3 [Gopherus evgoodei]|uniref:receptor-transporting protein 1-like isoform X3 n=1 Tax=Gopherus evgoodei TaxID=1825980 RepID=UPI0011D021CF|nr:receptor-transporting protein 1-like isoform X3 [Gopherus evgoodei]
MKKLNMDSWREMFYEKIEEVKPQDHWDLKMDQNLDYNDLGPGWKQSLQEHSFASFQCSRCQHFWSSVQVVILFHMYLDQHRRKGWVKMRVFRQECYECSEGVTGCLLTAPARPGTHAHSHSLSHTRAHCSYTCR